MTSHSPPQFSPFQEAYFKDFVKNSDKDMTDSQNRTESTDQTSSTAINSQADTSTHNPQTFDRASSAFGITMPAQVQNNNFIAPSQEISPQLYSSMNLQSQQLQLQPIGVNLLQPHEVHQLQLQNPIGFQQQFAMTGENYNFQIQPFAQVPDVYIYGNVQPQRMNSITGASLYNHVAPLNGERTQGAEVQGNKRHQSYPSLPPMHLPHFVSTLQPMAQYQSVDEPVTSSSHVSFTPSASESSDSNVSQQQTARPQSQITTSSVDATTTDNNDPSASSSSSSPMTQPSRGKKMSHRKTSMNSYAMTPETALRNRCRICNKQFKRPSSLQTHYYSHTGEKIFKCPWQGCGKMFSVKSNMTRHYRLHERDTRRAQESEIQSRNWEIIKALGLSSNSSTVRQFFQPQSQPQQQQQLQFLQLQQPQTQMPMQMQMQPQFRLQVPPQPQQQLDAAPFVMSQTQPRDINQFDVLHRPQYQTYSPVSAQTSSSFKQVQYIPSPLVVDGNVENEQSKVPEFQTSPVQTIHSKVT
ncbi:hypothetical protein I9W82_001252 [Candida metapsilosis]|uniref:C2H2-type domain-containing protein n=1 Tax=Candida metapsilosis TaxID=273372 RepID=A0A8H7ZI45_9ASCO|nr:hypothetical protein I9W82_001252 [Candida metapsilosis]